MDGSTGNHEDELLIALKRLILTACNRQDPPESIDSDAALIGPDSTLGLDSLDVLQISVALGQKYNVRIDDSKQARRALKSVRALALFLQAAGAA